MPASPNALLSRHGRTTPADDGVVGVPPGISGSGDPIQENIMFSWNQLVNENLQLQQRQRELLVHKQKRGIGSPESLQLQHRQRESLGHKQNLGIGSSVTSSGLQTPKELPTGGHMSAP